MDLKNTLSNCGASSTSISSYMGGWNTVWHGIIHNLPIGKIAEPASTNGAISADDAREVINRIFVGVGPIIHLALAPHPTHDTIEVLQDEPSENIVIVGDGVICPVTKRPPSMMFATMVGDCPTIMITGKDHVAFLHAGSPEIFGGLLGKFADLWGDEQVEAVSISPGIGGANYEFPEDKVPENLRHHMVDINEEADTKGFDCLSAIQEAFSKMGIPKNLIVVSHVDPYNELDNGDTSWASNRWYRQRGQYSPRDLATVIVTPGPNWESPGHDLV